MCGQYSHRFVRSDGWFDIGDSMFITMEYLELGDLQKYLTKPFDESQARQIATQVLEGLGFMHESGFVHRDPKPGNIMIVACSPEWFVKIADFGTSKRRQEGVTSLRTMQQGTFGYAAPEVLGFSPSHNAASYTSSVDMWSLGVMVYILLTNVTPFPSIADLYKYISAVSPLPTEPLDTNHVSETARGFIAELLAPTPEKRLAASSALNHAWVSWAASSSCPGDMAVALEFSVLKYRLTWAVARFLALSQHRPPTPRGRQKHRLRPGVTRLRASPLAAFVEDYSEEGTGHCGPVLPPDSRYVLDLATEPVVENTATPWPAKTSQTLGGRDQPHAPPKQSGLETPHSWRSNELQQDAYPAQRARRPDLAVVDEHEGSTDYSDSDSDSDDTILPTHSDDGPIYRDNGIEKGEMSYSLVQCVRCMESVRLDKAPKLKCRHRMCRQCLEQPFRLSITSPADMPPRCCTRRISLKHADDLFDDRFKLVWNRKSASFALLGFLPMSFRGMRRPYRA